MKTAFQPAILRPVPAAGRFVTFSLAPSADAVRVLRVLSAAPADAHAVVGVGRPLVLAAGATVPGLRAFPDDLSLFPATQAALFGFWGHRDASTGFDACDAFATRFEGALVVTEEVESFLYKKGRDLSGFEDGTENPKGKAAVQAAIIAGRGPGLDGGSFVAVQRWAHDLRAIRTLSNAVQAQIVGRDRRSNREIADAPPSAHVKRTAQESFSPPAFIVRRSMPYGGVRESGLYFVAYGESLDRFERILRRMAGRDDGIVDGLFSYSRAVSGGYYFCPPLSGGKLDLCALLPAKVRAKAGKAEAPGRTSHRRGQ
jgi:putative iron-dependent peroxidase